MAPSSPELASARSSEPHWAPSFVSVIVPARNAADVIGGQLRALSAQTYDGRWEVVVVDNASTDDTVTVTERWRDRLPELRVLSEERRGSSHARNTGAAAAHGDLLAFCDADDEVEPGWLAGLAAAAAPDRILACSFNEVSLNEPHVHRWVNPHGAAQGLFDHLGYLPFARTAGLALPRATFDRLGSFNTELEMGEDVEYCWRAQLAGVEIVFVPAARVHYRFRTSIRALCRQARLVGRSDAALFARFRDRGMPPPNWRRILRAWGWLIVYAPLLLSSNGRGRWLRNAAYRAGRVEGSIRYRVLFP